MNSELTELLSNLGNRFNGYINRHKGIEWKNVEDKLKSNITALNTLLEMERTGGEPDVVMYSKDKNEYVFFDCSKETPSGRRNLCYDEQALEDRKKFKPKSSAEAMAKSIGIEMLNTEDYAYLQTLGDFDTKTSSWLQTPTSIRDLGGALFGDKRYKTVFTYHNGAESYYGSRGFRGKVRV